MMTMTAAEDQKEMKSIPVSKIDTLIADFKTIAKYDPPQEQAQEYLVNIIIPTLDNLKKESEEMIPLSLVEAFEKWLKATAKVDSYWFVFAVIIKKLEELTKGYRLEDHKK